MRLHSAHRRAIGAAAFALGLACLTAVGARADLVVYAPGQPAPVCHLKGEYSGAWHLDDAHLAVVSAETRTLRLRDCALTDRLADWPRGAVDFDAGLPWVVDGEAVRARASGAAIAQVTGLLAQGPGVPAAPKSACATGGPPDLQAAQPAGCDPVAVWHLRADGGLAAGTVLGVDRVRAVYPPAGERHLAGLTFVRDGARWLLAAPASGREAVHLYAVPEGTLEHTLEAPPWSEGGTEGSTEGYACDAVETDVSGTLLVARCDLGAVVWDRISGRAARLTAPEAAEDRLGAATRHPITGAVVAAWGRTVAEAADPFAAPAYGRAQWQVRFVGSGPGGDPRQLRFAPDGKSLWVFDAAAGPRQVRWPGGARIAQRLPPGSTATHVYFGGDGQVAVGLDRAPHLVVEAPKARPWRPPASRAYPAAFLPDGRLAYVGADGLCLGDAARSCDWYLATGSTFSDLAVSPDGRYLAFNPAQDGARIVDLMGPLPAPGAPGQRPGAPAAGLPENRSDEARRQAHPGPPFGVVFRLLRGRTPNRPAGARVAAGTPAVWPGAALPRGEQRRLVADGAGLQVVIDQKVVALDVGARTVTVRPEPAPAVAVAQAAGGAFRAEADPENRVWLRSGTPDAGPGTAWQTPVQIRRVGIAPKGDRVWVVGPPSGAGP